MSWHAYKNETTSVSKVQQLLQKNGTKDVVCRRWVSSSLLVCPLSSCSAERSFNASMRLKTLMRSTMSGSRLNAIIVCHVNHDILDKLDVRQFAADICSRSDIRTVIFGRFWVLTAWQLINRVLHDTTLYHERDVISEISCSWKTITDPQQIATRFNDFLLLPLDVIWLKIS